MKNYKDSIHNLQELKILIRRNKLQVHRVVYISTINLKKLLYFENVMVHIQSLRDLTFFFPVKHCTNSISTQSIVSLFLYSAIFKMNTLYVNYRSTFFQTYEKIQGKIF